MQLSPSNAVRPQQQSSQKIADDRDTRHRKPHWVGELQPGTGYIVGGACGMGDASERVADASPFNCDSSRLANHADLFCLAWHTALGSNCSGLSPSRPRIMQCADQRLVLRGLIKPD